MGDLERLTVTYWAAVQRIRQMAMPVIVKVIVLADLEVLYQAERAEIQHGPMMGPTWGRPPIPV